MMIHERPKNWRKVKIKDVCLDVTVGHVGPMANQYVDDGIPFLRSQNIEPFKLNRRDIKYISGAFHAKLKKSALKPGDVAVVRTGYPGTACVIPKDLPISNCADLVVIRPSAQINSHFLVSIFNSTWGRGAVAGNLVGVAQQHFNIGAAKELVIDLPPLLAQQKIAGILSAYDDLIENNTRRIAILEEMAQAIYREWFVNFRFPGHENVKLVDSPLGKIPEGWKATLFNDLLESMKGGDWGADQPTDIENQRVVVVRGTDFDEVAYGGSLRVPLRYISTSSLRSRQLQIGDILVENSVNAKSRCIGTPLLINRRVLIRLNQPAIAASFCKVFRFQDQSIAPAAYWHIRELRRTKRMEYYQNIATNGIGNFQSQKFAKEEWLILPVEPAHRSAMITQLSDACNAVSNLASRIANLRKTRDLLLPKLISGQVDVENFDIDTGELLVEAEA